MLWPKWVVPIAGSTGSALRAIVVIITISAAAVAYHGNNVMVANTPVVSHVTGSPG
jgi:hypothetical protein